MTSQKEEYGTSYYLPMIRRYLLGNSLFLRNKYKNVKELVSPKKGDKILEVGCSWGFTTMMLTEHGAEVTAIDSSKTAINLAKLIFLLFGKNKCRFLHVSCDNIRLKEKFDKITCIDLVEHLPEDVYLRMIKNCYNLLRKGGGLFIYTPNKKHLFEKIRKPEVTHHIGYKSMNYLIETLRNQGFIIKRAYYKPSHIPIYRQFEKLFDLDFSRRRICIETRRDRRGHT